MPWLRNDGYKDLVSYVEKSDAKRVVVTTRESAPAIFFLFYKKYDPALYQNEVRNSPLRDFDRVNFGRYEFSTEECPAKDILTENKKITAAQKNTLYINSSLCPLENGMKLVKTIKRTDGSDVFRILIQK